MQRWNIAGRTLFIRQGDITQLSYGAIVNAANTHLAGGSGVDGAIHRAAGGEKLQRACRVIIAEIDTLPPGEAVITPGFDLPAQHIIHTVGTIWRGGEENESELLRNAYLNSLRVAQQHTISTIAFPAISCGAYGYPQEDAAHIALSALKEGLEQGLVAEAGMVLHGEVAFFLWSAAAEKVL